MRELYTVKELAEISGISTRTLRYYDNIGLLTPERKSDNGYRVYTPKDVDCLQQILFYRELGFTLEQIKKTICSKDLDKAAELSKHMAELEKEKQRIELLISNVKKTIMNMNGEYNMTDKEKFEGFKQELIEKNEEQYGAEIRQKYGDATIDESNKKLLDMTESEYQDIEKLGEQIKLDLEKACKKQDPSSAEAQAVCELHKKWLCHYWPKGHYSKEAHIGIAQMYCDDHRFKAYYDANMEGCAEFLYEAIKIYCQ